MCLCSPGYTGDGKTCTPEASGNCLEERNCSPYGACSPVSNTNLYSCVCLPGYTGDGYFCSQLPETTTEDQRVKQECFVGVCWCPEGYNLKKDTDYCIPNKEATTPYPNPETTVYPNNSKSQVDL